MTGLSENAFLIDFFTRPADQTEQKTCLDELVSVDSRTVGFDQSVEDVWVTFHLLELAYSFRIFLLKLLNKSVY